MSTVKFENKTGMKIIAHRGSHDMEVENSCPAFVTAGVRTYFGVETDVHVTADGKYILHHDSNIKNHTGQDMVIEQESFDRLRDLRMFDTDGKTVRGDLVLPTLDEYLLICKKYGKHAVVELKENFPEKDVCGVAEAVKAAGMWENTTFISFYSNNLILLRKHFPDSNVQYLADSPSEGVVEMILSNNFDADIYFENITKEFIDLMHQNGHIVNAWTVNTVEDAERLADMGLDMITSDVLE